MEPDSWMATFMVLSANSGLFLTQDRQAGTGHNQSSKMLPQTGRSDERGPGGIATYLTGNSSCFFRNSIMY